MDKNLLLDTIKKVKESSKKNFIQKIDLIINLKNLNLKKPEDNIDLFVNLPHSPGKTIKVCALIGREMSEQASVFDKAITKEEFQDYQDKKIMKNLVNEYDYFVAQANLMTDVAKFFGRTLGPKNKMPNPKYSGVINPGMNLKEIKTRLEKTVRLKTKNETIIKTYVGNQNMTEEQISENILSCYNSLIRALPQEEANVKNIILKLTMGPIFKVEKAK
jgi:large subunit ribosomal protein L1